jgi:hypothetical protein
MLALGGTGTQDTVPAGSHFRSSRDRRRFDIALVDHHRGFSHVLGVDERCLRNRGHPTLCRLVDVMNIGVVCVVVDVRDGDVIDRRVADVDAVDVLAAGAI